jgi:hypothetical protein
MQGRGLVAGALLLLASTVSCAPPAEDGDDGEDGVSMELPLDLTLDHVDVVHGSLRLRATMADGSPDVSIVLGDGCDGREVGRGMATRVSLVWALDENDLADALRCNLVVRVHAWTDEGRVVETSALELVPEVTLISPAEPDDAVPDPNAARAELVALGRDPTAMSGTFRSLTPRATLAVADSRIERTRREAEDGGEDPVEDDTTATFVVPYETFARALLEDRPLRVDGTAFEPSVSVGVTALERDSDDTSDSTESEGPGETEEEEGENGTPNEMPTGTEELRLNEIKTLGVTEELNMTEEVEEPEAANETQSP